MKNLVLSTCIYLQRENQTLFLYRNKKKDDFNKGYDIGIGGKLEFGESPEECIIREVKEETNLDLLDMKLIAYVTFIMDEQEEGMFLYTSNSFKGEMTKECSEGILHWVDNDQIENLPLLEGDRYMFKWFDRDRFVSAKLVYLNNQLVDFIEKEY